MESALSKNESCLTLRIPTIPWQFGHSHQIRWNHLMRLRLKCSWLLSLLLISGSVCISSAQTWKYTNSFSPGGLKSNGDGIAVADDGTTYISGTFDVVSDNPSTSKNETVSKAFIQKRTSFGGDVIWTTTINSDGPIVKTQMLRTHNYEGSLIFYLVIEFDGTLSSTVTVAANGAKHSSSVGPYGLKAADGRLAILEINEVDPSSPSFIELDVLGQYRFQAGDHLVDSDATDFGNKIYISFRDHLSDMFPSGHQDVYTLGYIDGESLGDFAWIRPLVGGKIAAITIAQDGGCFVAGTFKKKLWYGPGNTDYIWFSSFDGSKDIFVVKFDFSGKGSSNTFADLGNGDAEAVDIIMAGGTDEVYVLGKLAPGASFEHRANNTADVYTNNTEHTSALLMYLSRDFEDNPVWMRPISSQVADVHAVKMVSGPLGDPVVMGSWNAPGSAYGTTFIKRFDGSPNHGGSLLGGIQAQHSNGSTVNTSVFNNLTSLGSDLYFIGDLVGPNASTFGPKTITPPNPEIIVAKVGNLPNCNAIDNLMVISITPTSAHVTWTDPSPAGDYQLIYRAVGDNTWLTNSAFNGQYLMGLQPGTRYEVRVSKNCGGNSGMSDYTSIFFTTDYCTSAGADASFEWIELVALATTDNTSSPLNNASGNNGGYGNFTGINPSPQLKQGGSYTLQFSAGTTITGRTEYWKAWIDFNHNNNFNDPGEEILNANSTSTEMLSANLSVPATAQLGKVRMRVSMKNGSASGPCELFALGEVEDYTIEIVRGNSSLRRLTFQQPKNLQISNIEMTSANLRWTDATGIGTYTVSYRAQNSGASWSKFTVTGVAFTQLINLVPGTRYEVTIARVYSNGRLLSTPPSYFTTKCPVPQDLAITNVEATTATVTWTDPSDVGNYLVNYRISGTSSWTTINVNGSTLVRLTRLNPRAHYEVKISRACTTLAWSVSLSFVTASGYCDSKGTSQQHEWINYVGLGTMVRASGSDGGYINTTGITIPVLDAGVSFGIGVSAGSDDYTSSRVRYWKAWIDFNQNGVFDDPTETVMNTSSQNTSSIYYVFTIPAAAKQGSTRLRVSVKDGSAPGPCEAFDYGEVEDYTVYIISNSTSTERIANRPGGQNKTNEEERISEESAASAYPVPVTDILHVLLPSEMREARVAISDLTGKKVWEGSYQEEIEVRQWSSGVYVLTVSSETGIIHLRFIKQ